MGPIFPEPRRQADHLSLVPMLKVHGATPTFLHTSLWRAFNEA